MGRRRKAWLWGGNGRRHDRGRRLPGFYVRFNEYNNHGGRTNHSKNFLKYADAVAYCRQHNARQDLGELGRVIPISLSEASREFTNASMALASSTLRGYRAALTFLAETTGPVNVSQIDGRTIDKFISERCVESQGATVQKHLRYLHKFFKWADKRSYIDGNPVEDATAVPSARETRERPIMKDIFLKKLVKAADTQDRKLAILIGLTTGLDRNKIENLYPSQIDLDAKIIRIVRPKTNKQITVPIHDDLCALLARQLRKSDPQRPLLSGLQRQTRGKDWWKRATVKAQCEGLWFRDLRAVASTRLQRAGASPADAQKLLGHASAVTTMKHYSMPDPDTVERLNAYPLPGIPRSRARKRAKPKPSCRRRLKRA